jgi:hypothetical protein
MFDDFCHSWDPLHHTISSKGSTLFLTGRGFKKNHQTFKFFFSENSLRNWMKTFFVTNCDLNQTIVSCFIYIMIRNRKDFKVNFFLHFLFSNHEGRKKNGIHFFFASAEWQQFHQVMGGFLWVWPAKIGWVGKYKECMYPPPPNFDFTRWSFIMIRNRKDFKVNFFLHFLFSNHEGRKKTAFIFFWPT